MGNTTCQVCGVQVKMQHREWRHEDGSLACLVNGTHHISNNPVAGDLHCDFCNASEVNWTLITRSRVTADIMEYDADTLDTLSTQTHNMSEDWAACDDCHKLIVNGDWDAVAEKVAADVPAQFHDEIASAVKELHQEVRKVMIEWQHDPGGVIGGR